MIALFFISKATSFDQRVLSTDQNSTPGNDSTPPSSHESREINVNGVMYRSCNVHKVVYSYTHARIKHGALVDRGANGGICGGDTRVFQTTGRTVDIQGIDSHQIVNIPVVSAGAVVKTHRGNVILIFHQYAHVLNSKTIHSSAQLEMFGNSVDEKSLLVPGGKQCITTPDGYCIPLNIKSGLPYMSMRPYTDSEWNSLPHVIMTSDATWDPTVLDNTIDDNETWFNAVDSHTHTQQPFPYLMSVVATSFVFKIIPFLLMILTYLMDQFPSIPVSTPSMNEISHHHALIMHRTSHTLPGNPLTLSSVRLRLLPSIYVPPSVPISLGILRHNSLHLTSHVAKKPLQLTLSTLTHLLLTMVLLKSNFTVASTTESTTYTV